MKLRNNGEKRTKSCSAIISETYRDFAENTSIHGLKYTVKQKIDHYEKLFWILIVLCGLCGSGYMTVLFWERYTSNPTRTTVLNAYAPTTAIPFPAVTICNINKIFLSKVEAFIKELDINGTDESIVRHAFSQLLLFTHPNAMEYNVTELDILQNILINNGHDDTTLTMEKINQNCEEMLLYCLWNKQPVPCKDIFKKSVSYNGICCSFNYNLGESNQDIYSPFSGIGSGLKVLLNPMLQTVQYSALRCSGFKVLIHSSTEYLGSQCDSKLLPVGRALYLQILGTKMTCSKSVKNLPISQRGCLYPDELRLKYSGDKYSADNCFTECEYDLFFQQCGCVPFYYTFRDKPICNISKIPCLCEIKSSKYLYIQFADFSVGIWATYVIHLLNQLVATQMKSCNCIPLCENVLYNIFSTGTSLNYKEHMSTFFGNTQITEDAAVINIFFLGDKQTVLLRDTITSTIYLLSSFGGVYSLFMGCSLITIVEIIYYCLMRFTFNMNAFGKVNIDIVPEDKTKARKKRNPPQRSVYSNNYFGSHPQRFYYGTTYLP